MQKQELQVLELVTKLLVKLYKVLEQRKNTLKRKRGKNHFEKSIKFYETNLFLLKDEIKKPSKPKKIWFYEKAHTGGAILPKVFFGHIGKFGNSGHPFCTGGL
jgi:hypothetical protein